MQYTKLHITFLYIYYAYLKNEDNEMQISESLPYWISAASGGMFMDYSEEWTHSFAMSQCSRKWEIPNNFSWKSAMMNFKYQLNSAGTGTWPQIDLTKYNTLLFYSVKNAYNGTQAGLTNVPYFSECNISWAH